MLRKIVTIASLICAAAAAEAADAARVVFVAGDARVAGRAVELDATVREGDEISTGADGYIYLKTVDNGFLILRPSSRARIASYQIDQNNPSNNRIKLELLNGVARNISGEAVKQSRQNFRFNTPVAAIGVRGTDFTVYTDQETSRVAVISGGVVVAGFSGACGPEGAGPCEGSASRELFANQAGQLLQVRKGQAAPQLLSNPLASPDTVSPPRSDEPAGKTVNVGSLTLAVSDVSLDPHKNAQLIDQINRAAPSSPGLPSSPGPLPDNSSTTTPGVAEPQRQVVWGRWQQVLDRRADFALSEVMDGSRFLVALNSYFAILRSKSEEWRRPEVSEMAFALKQSEAYVQNDVTRQITPATVENGKLQVNFANSRFNTSFDLLTQQQERFKLQAQGIVSQDGYLQGQSQFVAPTNANVQGILGADSKTAAYIFNSRLDAERQAFGITSWEK
jgi:hypothetical protein